MRVTSLSLVFLLIFFALVVRLFYWQIVKGEELSQQARGQYNKNVQIPAPRGNILASDGTWLVGRSEKWLLYANPNDFSKDAKRIANELAPFFVDRQEDDYKNKLLIEIDRIESKLNNKDLVWIALINRVDDATKRNIEALGIDGIGFEKEESRLYPEGSSSAHVLGFVGKNESGDNMGYFGLEGFYELSLSGKPGYLTYESDARGIPILIGDSKQISAIGGVNLLAHIDKAIQLNVEKKLTEGMEIYGAKAGNVIVIDPKTGAVFAMASYPSYDPDKYYDFGDSYFKNPVVSDSFEPGSIFKILIMASALDSKTVEPDTKCEVCDGPLIVDKYAIETWNQQYNPDSTMTDVIVRSDNVGMASVGSKMGADLMYDYLSKFGIGSLTGIDLQGEASPKLRAKGAWNIVDLATVSFGQGVAATPIQIVKAVSAIANDGEVMTPQVVDKIQGGDWEEDIDPINEGRIISKKAANDITLMMVEAAKFGEAKWTHLRGFNIAGKTGTAQIPIAGHYDKEKTIASFIGFAPADDPKFLMLVTLREPESSPWASETAAPLWYSIAKDLFLYFGIQPEN